MCTQLAGSNEYAPDSTTSPHFCAAAVQTHSKTRRAAVDAPGTREARSPAPPAETQTPSPTSQLHPAAEPPARRPAAPRQASPGTHACVAATRAPETSRRPAERQLGQSEELHLRRCGVSAKPASRSNTRWRSRTRVRPALRRAKVLWRTRSAAARNATRAAAHCCAHREQRAGHGQRRAVCR